MAVLREPLSGFGCVYNVHVFVSGAAHQPAAPVSGGNNPSLYGHLHVRASRPASVLAVLILLEAQTANVGVFCGQRAQRGFLSLTEGLP